MVFPNYLNVQYFPFRAVTPTNAREGNYPHFHFQMRLNNQQFINYSETHIPFSDEDLWRFAMTSQNEIPFMHDSRYGEGDAKPSF